MNLELGLKITRNSNDLTLDCTETEHTFVLLIHLPGLKIDEMEISINQEGTEISVNGGGGRSILEDVISGRLRIHIEVEAARFRKVFRIPNGVILDQIEARCDEEKGNLFVIVPKSIKGCSPEMRIEEINQEGHVEKEIPIDPDDRRKSQEWEAPDPQFSEGFLNEENTSDQHQKLLEPVELHSPGALDRQEPETIQNGDLEMKETGVSEEKEQEAEVLGSEKLLGSRSLDVQEPEEIKNEEHKTDGMGTLEEKEQERENLGTGEIRMLEEKDQEAEALGLGQVLKSGTSDVQQHEEIRNGELKTEEKGNKEQEIDPPGKGQIQMLDEKEKGNKEPEEIQHGELKAEEKGNKEQKIDPPETSHVQQPQEIQNGELKTEEKGNKEQEIDHPVKGEIQMLNDKEKETQALGLGQLVRSGTSHVQQPEEIRNGELTTNEKGNKEQEMGHPVKGKIQKLEDREKETQALGLGQLFRSGTSDVQQPEKIQNGGFKTDEKGNKEQEIDHLVKEEIQKLEDEEKETQELGLGQLFRSGTSDVQQPEEIRNGELKTDEEGNKEQEIDPLGKGQIQMLEGREKETQSSGLGQLLRSGTSDVRQPEEIQNEELKAEEKGYKEQEIDPPVKGNIQTLDGEKKEAQALGLGNLFRPVTSDMKQPEEIRNGDLKMGEIRTPEQTEHETEPLGTEEMETPKDTEQGTKSPLGLDEVKMKAMGMPKDKEKEKETETLGVEKPKMEGMGIQEEKEREKEYLGSEEINTSGPSDSQSIQENKNGELEMEMRAPDGENQERGSQGLEEISRTIASHSGENEENPSEEHKMKGAGLSEGKEQKEGADEEESREARSLEPEEPYHGDPSTEVLDRGSDALEPDAKLDQCETSHAELDQHKTSDSDKERTQRDLEGQRNSLAELQGSDQEVLDQGNETSKEGEASSNERSELGFGAKEKEADKSGREWRRRGRRRRRGRGRRRSSFSSFPLCACMMVGSASSAFLFSLVVLANHFIRANGQ